MGYNQRMQFLYFNYRNMTNWTSLYICMIFACNYTNHEMACTVIRSDVVKPHLLSIQDGATPLFLAVANGNYEVVKLLVQGGANVNHKAKVRDLHA